MTGGGWFDAEDLVGPLKIFRAIEKNDPKTSNHLVMGPWAHGAWAGGDGDRLGHVRFNSKTGEYYRKQIEFPFFDFHLNGDFRDLSGLAVHLQALMFDNGAPRGVAMSQALTLTFE